MQQANSSGLTYALSPDDYLIQSVQIICNDGTFVVEPYDDEPELL